MTLKGWIILLFFCSGCFNWQRSLHTSRLAVANMRRERPSVATEVIFSTFVAENTNANVGYIPRMMLWMVNVHHGCDKFGWMSWDGYWRIGHRNWSFDRVLQPCLLKRGKESDCSDGTRTKPSMQRSSLAWSLASLLNCSKSSGQE